jgi:CheY-like chemotaxis protein/anti-sigma regulatory factor (Ser/Thr protein kinase)
MVNDFLDYTRADHVKPVEFVLAPVVQGCLANIEPIVDSRRVRVSAEIPDGLPRLNQDERKLKRIIVNLLGNATKFTENGEIRIAVQQRGHLLDISVTDTGAGIAPEYLERIFEEFQRVENRGERPREGTGLGLAICRRFATLMAGAVTVRSVPGHGSTFTLTIPIVHPQATAGSSAAHEEPRPDMSAAPPARPAPGPVRTRTAAVLIVDDSKENRDFLTQLLEKQYRTLIAEDGTSAIRMAQRERPDIILMDLSLPVVDGWEAARTIKSDIKLRSIPIVAVTAHATEQDQVEARAAGCDDFRSQPVDEQQLRSVLQRWLALAPAE